MPLKQEIFRKIFHLFLTIIPVLFVKFGKVDFLKFFAPCALIIILLDYARIKFSNINKFCAFIFKLIMRDKELNHNKLSGMSWAFGSALINFTIFHPIIAITGFSILIFSDSMAAVIGKSIKSRPFYQKSLAGSLTFFITAILVIICCGYYFDCHLSFFIFAIFIAMFITFLEAYPDFLGIDDNFLIPFVFGILMSLMNFMWHII